MRRVPLRYAEGADAALDRGAHVRAASGAGWVGERIAIIQDDTSWVALVDPATGLATAIALPATDGIRQFDKARGNKKQKLDLEAMVVVAAGAEQWLLAFGSGSSPRRERIAVVRDIGGRQPASALVDAAPLYASLRACVGFAGADMNVEGAAVVGDVLRLFGRGNGAPYGAMLPRDATCDIPLGALLAWLADPTRAAVPEPSNVVAYDLGTLAGIRLGFTDAVSWPGPGDMERVLFTAAAEASPDAVRDGAVSGSVIGLVEGAGARAGARWAPLTDSAGALLAVKVEGIVRHPSDAERVLVVADADDALQASELLEVAMVNGDWMSP